MMIETSDFRLEDDTEPGRVVRGRVVRPKRSASDEPRPGVVIVHGFKGFFRWGFFPELQRRLAEGGFVAVALNLSGSGVGDDLENFTDDEAFFRSTPSRDVEDLARVRRRLEAGLVPGLDVHRLGILGHSRGGGTALLHVSERGGYRACVTWASVARTVRFPKQVIDDWRREGVAEIPNARTGQVHRLSVGWLEDAERNRERLDIALACGRIAAPTLLVHGTADESVPADEGRLLERAFPPGLARLLLIEGAGHTFGAVHPFAGTTPELERALGATLEFLVEHLHEPGRRGQEPGPKRPPGS